MNVLIRLLFLVIFISFNFSYAQYTDVINSNRPGASESAYAVGVNVAQVEFGAFSINEDHALLNTEVSGFGLDFSLRYGLFFEQLELSVDGTYQNDTQTFNSGAIPFENDRANFSNFVIGAHYLIFDPYKNAEEDNPNLYSYHANRKFKWKSLIPAVGVYVGANIDSKDNPFTAPDVEGISPKLMVSTQNNFNGGWVFVMNLIHNRIGSDFAEFQYIFTLTHSINPQWVIFGETQGISSDFYADNIFRLGGAYLWHKDFQIDTSIAFNTKDTPSIFNVNLGVSYRLDFHKDKKIDNNNTAKDEAKRQNQANQNRSMSNFDQLN